MKQPWKLSACDAHDCTERHTPPPRNDVPGEGQEGMPKVGTA